MWGAGRPVPGWTVSAVLALLLAVVSAGCGAGQEAATANQRTNAGGANGQVGEMAVENVQIVYDRPVPGGAVYPVGASAPLQVTIVNTGLAADRLVGITTPVAASVAVTGEALVPGGQVLVAGYTDPVASIDLPDATTVRVTLQQLTTPLRAGLTYPMTFAFERAGTLTLEVPVQNPDVLPPRAGPPDLDNADEPVGEAEVPAPAEAPEVPR